MKVLRNRARLQSYFQITLMLVVVSLPFGSRAFNSIAIILTVLCWLLMSTIQDKIYHLRKQTKRLLIGLIPFAIYFVSAIVHLHDFQNFSENIQLSLPLLLFPLLYATTDKSLIHRANLLKVFSYATVASALLAIMIGLYLKLNMYGDYLFYDKFAILLNKHTTYFSLFVVVAILMQVELIIRENKHRIWRVLLVIFLLYTLYLLSTRIALVALSIGLLLLLIFSVKSRVKWLVGITGLLLTLSMLQLPNFVKRFDENPYPSAAKTINDFDYRKLHWKSVIQCINQNPLLGLGNDNQRASLYEKYRDHGLLAAQEEQYNAHNQCLEYGLFLGYPGMILFVGFVLYMLYILYQRVNKVGVVLLLVFLVFCFTESMLVRQSGIVFFSTLIVLYFYPYKE